MDEEDIKIYLEKYVKIILKNNFTYRGVVIGYDSDSVILLDKRDDSKVTIALSEISVIVENRGEEKWDVKNANKILKRKTYTNTI